MKHLKIDFFGKAFSFEAGKLAQQANGSVLARYGDTMVLVTATAAKEPDYEKDFFPLSCTYLVKRYAHGKIPGGFIKRETNPPDSEKLIARLIDRPIRPLFDNDYMNETQVIATVISHNIPDCPIGTALTGASTALLISDIPFNNPVAGLTIGYNNGKFLVNPVREQLAESSLNLFMAGTEEAIVMVESAAKEIEEQIIIEALEFGHEAIQPLIQMQKELQKEFGKTKMQVKAPEIPETLKNKVQEIASQEIIKALTIPTKQDRSTKLYEIKKITIEKCQEEDPTVSPLFIQECLNEIKKNHMRQEILENQIRIDKRKIDQIRPITCEVGILPKTHGSALFTRGETQALVAVTLGAKEDEQMIDEYDEVSYKQFYMQYNFPSFSVGEVGRIGAPSRREIGHGNLAERGLSSNLPEHEVFPYTIRIVSEILACNGSSSMASVCGGSLSLMDAGVPVKKHVAGIAMGLISEGDRYAILSDILGDEDHIGDMDFKVVGTAEGITALQMDIKIKGLSKKIMQEALMQAKEGRIHILSEMNKAIVSPRENIAQNAPKYIHHKIPVAKIKNVIGSGGKNIKEITAKTATKINIEDNGMISIFSSNSQKADEALAMIKDLSKDVEIGTIYEGKVKNIMDFGAFIEIIPGTDGLLHISEITEGRLEKVTDVINEGQIVKVKVLGFDKRGKIKLTAKNLDS